MSGRPRVLVVDDELPLRELITVTLADFFDCAEASSGKEALERLRESQFDLVVLDVMLPDVSGIEVLRTIRGEAQLSRVPVLVVSAWQSQEDLADALKAGADKFLPKPFKPDDLATVAQSLVGRAA